ISLLSELPPKFASVMRCLFLDGLSIKETSAVLNISEELVRKRCERARKLLKLTTTNLKKETHHER
ncbi:MAG: sigma-70 family RNA polymerase sigma factor, partial [Clostridia bacterium]|nr:sigma-70 family RNA polymerase sigma factor [Clostridia bacterium]